MYSKKRILITHPANDLYGASKIILQVVDLLLPNGYEVVFVLPYMGELSDELVKRGVDVRIFNLGVLRNKYNNIPGLFNRFFKILGATRKLTKIIKEENIDLVYTNTSLVFAPGIAAKLTRRPHILHIHEILRLNSIFSKVLKKSVNAVTDHCIVVSKSVLNGWKDVLQKDKLHLIYNGINTIPSSSNKDSVDLPFKKPNRIITSISRIIPYKGHGYFIDVANECLLIDPTLKFMIVGEPFLGYEDYLQSLKNKVLDYGLESSIVFVGHRNDIDRVFEQTTLLYHSAIGPDPLPTVILESMIASVPVAANNLGGPTEMVSEDTGVLVPYNDSKKAAEIILNFVQDKDRLNRASANGPKRVNSIFSTEAFESNMLKLLNEIE